MDRGAWWVTVHGVTELDTTSKLHHHYCHPVPALLWDSILLRKTAHSQGGRVPRTRLWSPLPAARGCVSESAVFLFAGGQCSLQPSAPLVCSRHSRVLLQREQNVSGCELIRLYPPTLP